MCSTGTPCAPRPMLRRTRRWCQTRTTPWRTRSRSPLLTCRSSARGHTTPVSPDGHDSEGDIQPVNTPVTLTWRGRGPEANFGFTAFRCMHFVHLQSELRRCPSFLRLARDLLDGGANASLDCAAVQHCAIEPSSIWVVDDNFRQPESGPTSTKLVMGGDPRALTGLAIARNCGLGCTRGARKAERAGAAARVGRITGRAVIAMEAIRSMCVGTRALG